MLGKANMSNESNTKKTTTLQVRIYPEVRSAARIRAEQRRLSLGGHISDLVRADAEEHGVWALVQANREEACGE